MNLHGTGGPIHHRPPLGYARVSTYGQTLDAQLQQFRAEGCAKVYREKASGAQLAQLAATCSPTRLDPRPPEHAGNDHRQGRGLSFAE
jgi:hypothetical protein